MSSRPSRRRPIAAKPRPYLGTWVPAPWPRDGSNRRSGAGAAALPVLERSAVMWSPPAREQSEREGQPPRDPPPAAAAAGPATSQGSEEGEAMAYVRKRKTPEQEPSVAKDQHQLYQHLVTLTLSKVSLQYNNFYRLALLKSTMLRNKVMEHQEKAARRMSQGNWEDLPESSNGAGTASSEEAGKGSPSAPDACQPTAFGMGHSPNPTSIFSGQSGGPGAHDGSLVQPLTSALEETCCGTDLQADHGKGSHPDTEEPASLKAEVPLAAFSEDPSPSNQEETSLLDTLPEEDLFSSVLSGSFEILAANYLSDVTSEELFADIDISEFETTPAPLPSGGGQGPPVHTEQDLRGMPPDDPLHLLTQDANERGGWEYFVE